MADIPGIIEGAHAGKGLGLKFLQHVERTRVLAFLVPLDSPDPQATYAGLRDEVRRYSETLAETPHLLLLSKRDLLPSGDPLPFLEAPDAAGRTRRLERGGHRARGAEGISLEVREAGQDGGRRHGCR